MDNAIAEKVLNMLAGIYVDRYDTIEVDYDTVDAFYAYLGYDLGAIDLLQALSIQGTSDLKEDLEKRLL